MIFNIKMEDFRRKAQYVAVCHTTVAPPKLTYASVFLQEIVHIALTLAALNDMEVKISDIQNTYLTASYSDKICTTLGS